MRTRQRRRRCAPFCPRQPFLLMEWHYESKDGPLFLSFLSEGGILSRRLLYRCKALHIPLTLLRVVLFLLPLFAYCVPKDRSIVLNAAMTMKVYRITAGGRARATAERESMRPWRSSLSWRQKKYDVVCLRCALSFTPNDFTIFRLAPRFKTTF